MIPQEVRDLAAGIADDIEAHGHYVDGTPDFWTPENKDAPCCLVQSPSWYRFGREPKEKFATLLLGYPFDLCESDVDDITVWNDETPTDEVLAALRKIAAGERP
jgi:hypothetical protein